MSLEFRLFTLNKMIDYYSQNNISYLPSKVSPVQATALGTDSIL